VIHAFPAEKARVHARIIEVKFTGSSQLGFRARAVFAPISPLPASMAAWTGKLLLEGEDAQTLLDIGKNGIASLDLVWPEGYKNPACEGVRRG
jgi:hypothetical protein